MLNFEDFSPKLDISSFTCGDTEEHKALDMFLKTSAQNYQQESLGITSVALVGEKVVGFVTLTADALRVEDNQLKRRLLHKTHLTKRLRAYPAMKICRLAVHKDYQAGKNGQPIGKSLLQFSFAIAAKTNKHLAIRFITVDAKEIARKWYLRNGFHILDEDHPSALFFDLRG